MLDLRAIIFGLVLLICGLAPAPKAWACSCMTPPSVETVLKNTDVVFSGKIVAIVPDVKGKRLVFNVDRAWKGVNSRLFSVTTNMENTSCSVGYAVGQEWLVYGKVPSPCGRTKHLSSASADIAKLGAGRAPSAALLWGGAVALVGVGSILAVLWIQKRRARKIEI